MHSSGRHELRDAQRRAPRHLRTYFSAHVSSYSFGLRALGRYARAEDVRMLLDMRCTRLGDACFSVRVL